MDLLLDHHTIGIFVVVVVALIFAVIVAQSARYRGHSYWLFFVLSLLLTPILAILFMAALPYRANVGKYIIPRRYGEEPKATGEQRRKLWKLGLNDEGLIESLGTRQAGNIINQLGNNSPMEWRTFVIALIVCPLSLYFLRKVYVDYQSNSSLHYTFNGLETWWRATPAPSSPEPTLPAPPSSAPAFRSATPAPVPRSATGPIVVTRPITIAARYGRVTIPVGARITVLSANQGQLTIRYAGETYIVPAAFTSYPQ
jgi:hypothetical protein